MPHHAASPLDRRSFLLSGAAALGALALPARVRAQDMMSAANELALPLSSDRYVIDQIVRVQVRLWDDRAKVKDLKLEPIEKYVSAMEQCLRKA